MTPCLRCGRTDGTYTPGWHLRNLLICDECWTENKALCPQCKGVYERAAGRPAVAPCADCIKRTLAREVTRAAQVVPRQTKGAA